MANPPSRIDKYELIRRIGHGGMGTVYLARHSDLDRLVAIKLLRDPLYDEELLARFFREARAAANLRHDNIITVYDVGQHDHQPFMAMEYVDGSPLSEIIAKRETLTLSEKISYLEQICSGLHFAHCAGIVHRDIKPANVMVDRHGVIRILDFGIARVEGSEMTRDGDMMGTLTYMSPEQMRGRPVDFRSDIYAVGAVAYELLAYQRAFRKLDTEEDGPYQRRPGDEPQPIADVCPGLPAELEAIVTRALAPRPEDRFGDLEEARAALREVRRTTEPELTLQPTPGRRQVEGKPPSSSGSPRDRTVRQRLTEAESKLSRGDITGAATLVQQVLELDPRDTSALALAGRLQAAAASATIVLSRALPRDQVAEPPPGTQQPRIDEVTTPLPAQRTTRMTPLLAIAAGVIALAAIGAWVFAGRDRPAPPQQQTAVSPSTATAAAPPPASVASEQPLPDAPAPAAAPAETNSALDDQLARINTAYVSGDLNGALRLVGPLLATTSDERLRASAKRIAQTAHDSMTAAERAAASQRSDELSRSTFEAAARAKALAGRAMNREDYVEAGTQALRAAATYTRAEREAVAAMAAAQTTPAQPRPQPAAAPPAVVTASVPPASNTANTGTPGSGAAPPPVTTRSESPAPAAPAPEPTLLDRERPGILATLNRYQAAYRDRSVKALTAVYPSLPRESRQALERAFSRDCRDYDVTFGNMLLALNADDPTYATVTVRSTYTCQPKGAQAAQPQSMQELFVLRKLGDGWLIGSAGVMDASRK